MIKNTRVIGYCTVLRTMPVADTLNDAAPAADASRGGGTTRMLLLAAIVLVVVLAAAGVVSGVAAAAMPHVPYFSSCDPRWGSDELGGDGPTLCSQICALTSATMVRAYYGVDADPQSLNNTIGRLGCVDQNVALGKPDDLPAIRDYEGDDNIGLYRPGTTTGVFHPDIDNDGEIAGIVTHEYGDIPIAGDFDDNIGVYRPGTGEFFVDASVPKTIYVDDDFDDDPSEHRWDTIQEGVDDADDGDTAIVYAGEYCENVNVNKRISLIGEDKNTTFVSGGGNEDVIQVTSDGCTISGFTIQSREHSIVSMVEIRGEVAAGSFTWTPANFAGFYYDINANVGDETLTIITSGRTVYEGDLVYKTTSDLIDFEYSDWGGYQVIGFMVEKYFAGYGKDVTDYGITNDDISLISNDMLSKVLIDEDEKHMISTGASLELKEGYELKIIQLDINGGQAQIELLKNGRSVDTAFVRSPDTYVYKKDLGKLDDVPLVVVHIKNVFAGTESDIVTIGGIFQISDDYVSIETGTDFDVMEVKAVSSAAVLLKNEEYIDLDEGCTEHIMGNIYLITADNDSLIFYPMVRYTEPCVHEVRGEVQYVTGVNPEIVWDAHNFGGLYYDPDGDTSTETLSVAANTINWGMGDQTIDESRLMYRTAPAAKRYELNENEGCNVESNNPDGDAFYWIEGWMGEPRVAINNKANKLCKLLVEFDSRSDKKTMSTGENWDLGRGFALTAKEIDHDGNSVWLSLSKNGKELDNQIIDIDTGNEQDQVYTYTAEIGEEKAIPVFSCYVDAVFRGTESNLVQVKYVFLIDDHVLEIEAGDRYGAMEVITANSSEIVLKNDKTAIDLDAGTTIPIMDHLYFRAADDGATIRFYPFVVKVIRASRITDIAGIRLNSADNNILTDNEIRLGDYGIRLQNSDNNTITGNDINSNNEYGIYLSSSSNNKITGNTASGSGNCGIFLCNSDNNNITSNIAVNNNYHGITIDSSSNNTLINNTANSNNWGGIDLWYSSNNTLTGNTICNNRYNFGLYGWNDTHFDNSIDISNRVDGKPIYYVKDASDLIIDSAIDAGTIYCIRCDNITVKDVFLTNNGAGVFFWKTNSSTIEDVNASKNDYGVCLWSSNDNTLIRNTALNNNHGIDMWNSNDSMLIDNAVSNNWEGINLRNSSNNILLSNDAGSNTGYGVNLQNSGSNILISNTIPNNWEGISLRNSCSNNLISNIVLENNNGINLWNSGSNMLNKNTASGNDNGIYLWNSKHNTLTGNLMSGNRYNFGLFIGDDSYFDNNIDTTNLVDGKPIYYAKGASDIIIDSTIDAGVVYCIQCDNITVKDVSIANNDVGVFFWKTNDSRIENVSASNSDYGICIYHSDGNDIVRNIANSNNEVGIYMDCSSNNTLANNNVSNNRYGIRMYHHSGNNTLVDTNASNNDNGICLYDSSDNTLTNNNVSNNRYDGIRLYHHSSNNTLVDNIASNNNYHGIDLGYSSNNTLVDNIASDNRYGIDLCYHSSNNTLAYNIAANNSDYGIYLCDSRSNTLANNTASNNNCGIRLYDSSDNTLAYNIASNNEEEGICLYRSSSNTLVKNTISENRYNFGVWGYSGSYYSRSYYTQNIDTSNTVDGKPIYYWIDQHDKQIPDDAGYVGVVNSTNITIRDLMLTNNQQGILFAYTDNSRIENVTASNNYHGIYLYRSSNNMLADNTASDNRYGIDLCYHSSDNNIYHNNLITNTYRNAYDYSGTNTWDSGTEGNYWSDYTGTDSDGDGIGDDPHLIPGGGSVDNYPLMQPWTTTPQKGDLNGDGILAPADAAIALQIAAGGSASCDPTTLAAADISGDGQVTTLDALMILQAAAGVVTI